MLFLAVYIKTQRRHICEINESHKKHFQYIFSFTYNKYIYFVLISLSHIIFIIISLILFFKLKFLKIHLLFLFFLFLWDVFYFRRKKKIQIENISFILSDNNLFIIKDIVILFVTSVTHRPIDVFPYDTDYIVLNGYMVDNDMFDLIMCGEWNVLPALLYIFKLSKIRLIWTRKIRIRALLV